MRYIKIFANAGDRSGVLGKLGRCPEKGMVTSSILAWRVHTEGAWCATVKGLRKVGQEEMKRKSRQSQILRIEAKALTK